MVVVHRARALTKAPERSRPFARSSAPVRMDTSSSKQLELVSVLASQNPSQTEPEMKQPLPPPPMLTKVAFVSIMPRGAWKIPEELTEARLGPELSRHSWRLAV